MTDQIKNRFCDFVVEDYFDYFEVEAWDSVEEIVLKMRFEFWEIIEYLTETKGWHKLCAIDRFPSEYGAADERELLEEIFIHKMTLNG